MDKEIKSVKITEDIWFYPTRKGFEFTVWAEIGTPLGIKKQAVLFTLSRAKIKKYFNPRA